MKTSATAAYGLRENPKKSQRVADDSCSASTGLSDIVCKICGKGFSTGRQLCGHMRHHTIGERREVFVCKECGKRFKSIRSLCGHMKSHSSVFDGIGTIRADAVVTDCSLFLIPNIGVRKRARTPRFEVSRKRSHFEEGEESSALEEEVAASLIMLSQGLTFSNATVAFDGHCDVELVDQGLTSDVFESGNSEGGFDIPGFVSFEKISSEVELDMCNNSGEGKNVEFGNADISGVEDEGFVGQTELGGVCIGNSDRVKSEDGVFGVSGSGLKYRCISCDKDFSPHQALGGHMSSKHRWRGCSKTEIYQRTKPFAQGTSKKPERAADSVQMVELSAVGVPRSELLKGCEHKCALCFKVFQSAQALGGHMGAHVAERTTIDVDQVQQPGSKLRRCSSALQVKTCRTIQAGLVSGTEGTSEKLESTVDDVQKNETRSVGVAHFEVLKRCRHKCALCFKVFRSAQSLGSHMGAHVAESSTATGQVQQPGGSFQGTAVAELNNFSQSPPLASWKMVVS